MSTLHATDNVPTHVPAELVWNHDYVKFLGELDDPYLAASRLHQGPGIIWATNASSGKPAWIFTQHELIKEGFANSQQFSSAPGELRISSRGGAGWLLLPVEADAPKHQHYRQILRPLFTPEAVGRLNDLVQSMCDDLIDNVIDQGHCEFIGDFAAILPNALVIALLGMPRDMLPQFLRWETALIHGSSAEERRAASAAILTYIQSFIAEQHTKPTTDLMRSILNATIEGQAINDMEVFGMVYLLFVAGLDTVFNTLGWVMRHLATDQQLQAHLRQNPQDIPAAVDEFTRAYGVSAPARTVAEDMVFQGVTMKKGEEVLLPTYLAGRDPRAFADPHRIDITRRPHHVTFGYGSHLCQGIHLAKREIKIVIESFLARMDDIHIPAGETFQYDTHSTLSVDHLPIAWRKRER